MAKGISLKLFFIIGICFACFSAATAHFCMKRVQKERDEKHKNEVLKGAIKKFFIALCKKHAELDKIDDSKDELIKFLRFE